MNRYAIIITGRNSAAWVEKCLNSAVSQNYPKGRFYVVIVDAQSTDNTWDIINSFDSQGVELIKSRNSQRMYQVENIYRACHEHVQHGDVCVSLDMDDWLAHENVLSTLESEYYSKGFWMTFGRYKEFPERDVSQHYSDYPPEIRRKRDFRKYRWLASHLRTWRRELFIEIREKDLMDEDGDFFKAAGDHPIMLPMLEMAGDKAAFCPHVLYVYNRTNPESEDKIMLANQTRIASLVKSRPKYPLLTSI